MRMSRVEGGAGRGGACAERQRLIRRDENTDTAVPHVEADHAVNTAIYETVR